MHFIPCSSLFLECTADVFLYETANNPVYMYFYFSRCFHMDVETMMNQEKADFAVSLSVWSTIILSFFA